MLVGLLLLAVSVAGFLTAADALDERVPVLVTAVDIERGDVVEASHLTWTRASLGSIPYVPWSQQAAESFAGSVARWRLAAGSLVTDAAFDWPEPGLGATLGLSVPLDTSLTTETLADGDEALLIDPGVAPSLGDAGRPRRVIRSFVVENFDGSQMSLQLPPEEYLRWQTDILDAAGPLLALPIPLSADPEAAAADLDEAWQLEHEALMSARTEEEVLPGGARPGAGQLEVRLPVDTSLSPSGVESGDLVLLVDPGALPSAGDEGRPRAVLQPLLIEHYEGGEIVIFSTPEEWIEWQLLIERLEGIVLVVPVPAGTDVEDLTARLNAVWLDDWRDDAAGVDAG
ncbi:MAG: hypothetical protein OXJ90_22920 [Spirochaetaceae bacterium]|nr:hypothetical protein [Spirochaetaceae bacterium]